MSSPFCLYLYMFLRLCIGQLMFWAVRRLRRDETLPHADKTADKVCGTYLLISD